LPICFGPACRGETTPVPGGSPASNSRSSAKAGQVARRLLERRRFHSESGFSRDNSALVHRVANVAHSLQRRGFGRAEVGISQPHLHCRRITKLLLQPEDEIVEAVRTGRNSPLTVQQQQIR